MTVQTIHDPQAELDRARFVLKTVIYGRTEGRGIYYQLSHKSYTSALLRAVDTYLIALQEAGQ